MQYLSPCDLPATVRLLDPFLAGFLDAGEVGRAEILLAPLVSTTPRRCVVPLIALRTVVMSMLPLPRWKRMRVSSRWMVGVGLPLAAERTAKSTSAGDIWPIVARVDPAE